MSEGGRDGTDDGRDGAGVLHFYRGMGVREAYLRCGDR